MEKDFLTPEEHERMARFLAGEMDANEAAVFRNKMQVQSEKGRALQELAHSWNALPDNSPGMPIDTDGAWEKLNTRIENAALPENTTPEHKTLTIPAYAKWAAGWLLLIALGTMAYLTLFNTEKKNPMFTLLTQQENITLVQTLEDGSVIYLGNSSSFSFPGSFSPQTRNVKLQGEAFFDVSHKPGQPFIIETPHAIVEVLGTSFNLKSDQSNSLELFVESGLVRVSLRNDSRKTMTVEPGELLQINQNKLEKSFVQGQYNTAWRKNHMHFKDEKLENILHVLNQNYETEFAISDENLRERRLTVTFYNTKESTMAELIALSLNIDFEQQAERSILFKNKN